jgi:hypothetical protein
MVKLHAGQQMVGRNEALIHQVGEVQHKLFLNTLFLDCFGVLLYEFETELWKFLAADHTQGSLFGQCKFVPKNQHVLFIFSYIPGFKIVDVLYILQGSSVSKIG